MRPSLSSQSLRLECLFCFFEGLCFDLLRCTPQSIEVAADVCTHGGINNLTYSLLVLYYRTSFLYFQVKSFPTSASPLICEMMKMHLPVGSIFEAEKTRKWRDNHLSAVNSFCLIDAIHELVSHSNHYLKSNWLVFC